MKSKTPSEKVRIARDATIFPSADVIGDVTIGSLSNVWYHAVIRGDMAPISIGEGTNVQDGAIIHTSVKHPTDIGNHVTIGHGAIIHACTIEDGALIGMGSIVLDGAVVERNAMVAAGALIPPGKVVPSGHLALGSPMKVVRALSDEEIAANLENANHYIRLARE